MPKIRLADCGNPLPTGTPNKGWLVIYPMNSSLVMNEAVFDVQTPVRPIPLLICQRQLLLP